MAYIDCEDPACGNHGAVCLDCGRARKDARIQRQMSIAVCDACGYVEPCGDDPPFFMLLGEQGKINTCSIACARILLVEKVS